MQRETSYEHRVPSSTKAYSNGNDKSKSSSAAGVASRSSNGLNGNGIKGGFSYSSGHGNNNVGAAGSNASTSTEDGALYTVDHLATFTVGESYELVYPRDGLRRLREMEKSSGIWTQRMYLRVESNWVVIIDYENGDTVERFPMELVSEPTHFISQDPKELYNNILLFTVKEDPRSKGTSISEMHIFHCMKTSAEKIADSISLLMRSTASGLRRSKNLVIPPPPANSPPEPPSFASPSGHVKEKVHSFNNILVGNYQRHQSLNQEDDIESQSQQSDSTNYERDVAVLNHCFDDIERFIARLQYASAAYKELERRRRQRKSKKKEAGDGMLLMRARPPAEMEFVDIFQKFKLSFNLLAKLRSHIHDPNAPELIHFLFTPLALVVDASHDAAYGPNLAGRVVPPLLTQEAKQLLLNCLTSKESDLWASLGEAWTQTRQQWPVHVPTYYPTFHDGWEPTGGSSLTDGAERARNLATSTNRVESWKDDRDYEADSADYPFDEQRTEYQKGIGSSPSPRHSERDRDRHSDFSDVSENDFERRQRRFAMELEAVNAKRVVQVQYPRTGKNDKELTVQQGEILEVINDSRKWWQTRNSRGLVGYVPHTIVAPLHSSDSTDDASYRKYQNGRTDR